MFALTPFVSLLLALALSVGSPVHPHNPKAIVLQGAAGKVTVTYFTVPFNEERLKDLKPGFVWHLGRAALETDVPLKSGDETISAGKYRINIVRGDSADDWSIQLESSARAVEAAAGQNDKIALATEPFKMVHDEHLSIIALSSGYATVKRGSTEPTDGMEIVLRLSFGDLHRQLPLKEVYEKK